MAPLKLSRVTGAAGIALSLAGIALLRWPDVLQLPFLNDDYVFLDKVTRSSFGSLWGFRELAFHWWRPWSREFHYWTLSRAFGASEPTFHTASVLLFVAALVAYFTLVRRLAGARAAAFAALGAAAMAAWDLPLLWAAGSQDLWMMTWALLALIAWSRGRRALATLAAALALASKETAALMPAIVIAHDVAVARLRPAAAARRAWPLVLVTCAWVLVHPAFGGRLWHASVEPLPPSPAAIAPWRVPLRALLALVNLDAGLAPQHGWGAALARGLPVALVLVVAAIVALRATRRRFEPEAPSAAPAMAVVVFGATWALLGWAPLLQPGLGWHAYYALFGALGAWLAIAPHLARRPAVGVAALAAVALLGSARADTPSTDWGDAWYQRRAGFYVTHMREQLRALHPSFPAHARLWFSDVPSNVGFLAGDGPALRVWYRDSTLRAGFLSEWRPRGPGGGSSEDFFFRADSAAGWVELRPGDPAPESALVANPQWAEDMQSLAHLFLERGDALAASHAYRTVADALPRDAEAAYNAGVAFLRGGDTTSAAVWLAEAARRPIVNDRVRAAAEDAGLDLWPPAPH